LELVAPKTSLPQVLDEIARHAEQKPRLAGDFRHLMTLNAPNPTAPPLKLFSVVIPARDEEESLPATLEHLHLEFTLNNIPHEIVVGG